jgi:hypothetical protein
VISDYERLNDGKVTFSGHVAHGAAKLPLDLPGGPNAVRDSRPAGGRRMETHDGGDLPVGRGYLISTALTVSESRGVSIRIR